METKSDLFTVEDVKVRRVKHGIYVREDEWQQYLDFNKVRPALFVSSLRFPDDLW